MPNFNGTRMTFDNPQAATRVSAIPASFNGTRIQFYNYPVDPSTVQVDTPLSEAPTSASFSPVVIDLLGETTTDDESDSAKEPEQVFEEEQDQVTEEEQATENEIVDPVPIIPVPRDFSLDHHHYFGRRIETPMPTVATLYSGHMSSEHSANSYFITEGIFFGPGYNMLCQNSQLMTL
ncbi:hypothetical protein BD770DRAFT_432861, partial [Pilaira anomala]